VRTVKRLFLVMAFSAMPLVGLAQSTTVTQVVDQTVAQERAEVDLLSHYSPLVETYIQNVKPDTRVGAVPDGDNYFLGRAELAKSAAVEPLMGHIGFMHKMFPSLQSYVSREFEFNPSGFLQMIYVDPKGLDRKHYKFDYVGRQFLGEVRCFVFDVDPLPGAGRGRFVGRIWVEDQDHHIVRFNGTYSGSSLLLGYYFNFDSWRTRAGNGQWLPTFIYSEEGDVQNGRLKGTPLKAFKAQTRLWGYSLSPSVKEQELTTVSVDAETPVADAAEAADDFTPLQAERSWTRQAEDNVVEKMQRLGLMAPYGEVDKVLETVVNNLEVTNDLNIQPDIRCRVLMTSAFESFTVGHTIVLSRGLIDVIPDEATLAAVLAHEMGHILLGQSLDSEYAFFNSLRFNEKDVFHHFGFGHTPEEEKGALRKATELLEKSPYKGSLGSAQLFLQALEKRSKDIPALISPHLGDRVTTDWELDNGQGAAATPANTEKNLIVALPLGGRIKVEPWTDQLHMLKGKPTESVAEFEKMPFEVTPFFVYLTRQNDESPRESRDSVAVKSDAN